jgi:transposase
MLYLSSSVRYYFYGKIVDMRKGCYGLCGLVTNDMKKNILSGDVFVFMNKRHNKIKLLQWDKDGFALYEKRLEKGSHLQLQLILQGILLHSVRHKKRFAIRA